MSVSAVVTGSEDRAVADLDLVARVRAGDERAFEQLFVRYQPRIEAYVAGMVRDHARAEDITQEVFLSALRRLRDGSEREIQFRPWIYEIAKNKCIDAYRRGRHGIEVSFDAHDAVGADEHGRLASPRPTPDGAVEDKLALDNLCGAFGGLSPMHRDILVMREFEGLAYREIGERLGLSRPAVESTLFRARKRLSEEYEQLVSGARCRLVQRAVDSERGIDRSGLRYKRRMARHLAHCQPCRRYARLAGADLGKLAQAGRTGGAAARIAAVLPLPAFLRRRWGGEGDCTAQLLGAPGAPTVAQWSARVAATLDPAAVTGWTKAVATAVTVAVAGVGAGSAISDRAGTPAHPAFGVPVVQVAGDGAPREQPRGISVALQTSGQPAPDADDPPATGGGEPTPASGAGAGATASGSGPAAAAGSAPGQSPGAAVRGPLGSATRGALGALVNVVAGRDGRSAGRRGGGASPARADTLSSGDRPGGRLPGGSRTDRSRLATGALGPAGQVAEEASAPGLVPTASQTTSPAAGLAREAGAPTTVGANVPPIVPTITSATAPLTGLGR